MADTLESIFSSTSLGSTELDDGEHTIVTTNANTSFVIKDMHVNGTSTLANTHLELNGFNVSGITSNATGSLIIPPSSTLKIKTTDYPVSFIERTTAVGSASSNIGFQTEFINGTTNERVGSVDEEVISSPNYAAQIYDFQFTTASDGTKYIHYVTNDNNSQQRAVWYRRTAGNTGIGNIRNESYKPFGIYDNKVWYMESASLRFADIYTSPTSTSFSAFTNSSNYNSSNNSYSPYTTSSYPRSVAAHGFYWYIPSSGYTNDIYAIKLEGTNKGQFFRFRNLENMNTGGNNNFIPSYNASTDTLYLYRQNSNSNLKVASYSNWSVTSAQNSSSQINVDETNEVTETNLFSSNGNIDNNYIASSAMGYLSNGGFTYKNNSYDLIEVNPDFTVKSTTASLVIGGNTYNNTNGIFMRKEKLLSSSEATALSLTAPTFGLQLIGIRVTT